MSFCRFSTNDFSCDLYVYAYTGGGYICEVANNRVVGPVPPLHFPLNDTDDEITKAFAAYQEQMNFLRSADRMPITLPHAGAHFHEANADELYDLLLTLRSLGYHFPDDVLAQVQAEIDMPTLPADDPKPLNQAI